MNHITKGIEFRSEMTIDLYSETDSLSFENCGSCYRLLIVEKGSFFLDEEGSKTFVESPAVLCFRNNEAPVILKSAGLLLHTVYFKPSVINSLFSYSFLDTLDDDSLTMTERQDLFWLRPFQSSPGNGGYIKLGPSSISRILFLFKNLHSEIRSQPDDLWPCRGRSYFLELLYYLSSVIHKYESYKNSLENGSEPIEDILLYLHENYDKDISLEQLSSEFHINRTKINSLFNHFTGKSAIDYLINYRLRLACLILRDTTVSVKETAYRTGFHDLTHFGRLFKKNMNYTPSQYRNKFNWMLQ